MALGVVFVVKGGAVVGGDFCPCSGRLPRSLFGSSPSPLGLRASLYVIYSFLAYNNKEQVLQSLLQFRSCSRSFMYRFSSPKPIVGT